MQKGWWVVFVLLLLSMQGWCQQKGAVNQQIGSETFHAYQDTLARLGEQLMKSPLSPERIEANYQFIQTLVKVLKEPGSYDFPFDSVKNLRILYAPDNSFRIMSWY